MNTSCKKCTETVVFRPLWRTFQVVTVWVAEAVQNPIYSCGGKQRRRQNRQSSWQLRVDRDARRYGTTAVAPAYNNSVCQYGFPYLSYLGVPPGFRRGLTDKLRNARTVHE